MPSERGEPLRTVLDEFTVVEAFVDDDIGHGVEEWYVGAYPNLNVSRCPFRKFDLPRIDHHQLRAVLDRALHAQRDDRVGLGSV